MKANRLPGTRSTHLATAQHLTAVTLVTISLASTPTRAAPEPDPAEAAAKLKRAKQMPVRTHFTMVGSAGGIFGPAASPSVADMVVGARFSAGIFLSPRFALELEGGFNSHSAATDPEVQRGPESMVLSASLALRWYPRPIHRARHFHPYVTAGAGYHHLRLLIFDEAGESRTRYTAPGAGLYLGVGATTIVFTVFSVELRLVYRAFRFGTKHWKGPLRPAATSCCGGTAGWGHMLSFEIGYGLLL